MITLLRPVCSTGSVTRVRAGEDEGLHDHLSRSEEHLCKSRRIYSSVTMWCGSASDTKVVQPYLAPKHTGAFFHEGHHPVLGVISARPHVGDILTVRNPDPECDHRAEQRV